MIEVNDSEGRRSGGGSATRAALVEAAFGLFVERGFDAVTAEEIAAEVGVTRRTFFRHFETKSDVVWGYDEDRRAFFEASLRSGRSDRSHLDALRDAVLATDEAFPLDDRDRAYMAIVAGSPALQVESVALEAEFADVLIEWLAARTGRARDDVGLQTAAAVLNACRGVAMVRYVVDGVAPLSVVFDEVIAHIELNV